MNEYPNQSTLPKDYQGRIDKLKMSDPSKKRVIEAITKDGDMPQKRFFRQRAHCNVLACNDSFDYPRKPEVFDWSTHYPENKSCPTVLDIGCGFGGLTMELATLLPDETILGMEIRAKVTEYVRLRIVASRKENPGQFQNASVIRTNSMKFLPHVSALAISPSGLDL